MLCGLRAGGFGICGQPRFRRLGLDAIQHLAAPLLAGPRRADLEPEQPIDIREYVPFIVRDRKRADALAERSDLSDELVGLRVGDIDVRVGQHLQVDAAAVAIHPGVVRSDAENGMIVRRVHSCRASPESSPSDRRSPRRAPTSYSPSRSGR